MSDENQPKPKRKPRAKKTAAQPAPQPDALPKATDGLPLPYWNCPQIVEFRLDRGPLLLPLIEIIETTLLMGNTLDLPAAEDILRQVEDGFDQQKAEAKYLPTEPTEDEYKLLAFAVSIHRYASALAAQIERARPRSRMARRAAEAANIWAEEVVQPWLISARRVRRSELLIAALEFSYTLWGPDHKGLLAGVLEAGAEGRVTDETKEAAATLLGWLQPLFRYAEEVKGNGNSQG